MNPSPLRQPHCVPATDNRPRPIFARPRYFSLANPLQLLPRAAKASRARALADPRDSSATPNPPRPTRAPGGKAALNPNAPGAAASSNKSFEPHRRPL
jgi:hypothetical protein